MNKNRSERVRWIRILGGATLGGLLGCQSYEPSPLQPELHRAAWHARTVAALDEGSAELDATDGLSAREGQLVALAFNPDLRLARLRLVRAGASAEAAGLLADPELSTDVLRISEDVPDRWVATLGLEFTIPLSDRRGAARALASSEVKVAEQALLESEWRVLQDVRVAWLSWSAAHDEIVETERYAASLDELSRTALALAESGEIARTEAALFTLERARHGALLRGLRGQAESAAQALRAQLGLAPDAPVEFLPSLATEPVDGDSAALAARNPRLARLRAEYDAAEGSLRLEIARQIPDLTLGPLVESDAGQTRLGFLGGLPLPFFNGNARAIAEARADRELARAAYETTYERLAGELARARIEARAFEEQNAELQNVLLPMIDRQLRDALRLLALGEGESLVLLESVQQAHATQLELIETRRAAATAHAQAAALIGPPQTETTP